MFRIATQRWNLDRVGSWNISEYQQSVSDSKQEVSGRKKILTWNLKQLVDQGNSRLDQKQNPVTPADYVRRASSPVSVQTSRPPPLGIYPRPSSAIQYRQIKLTLLPSLSPLLKKLSPVLPISVPLPWGYGFWAVLVWKQLWFSIRLVIIRVWFLSAPRVRVHLWIKRKERSAKYVIQADSEFSGTF